MQQQRAAEKRRIESKLLNIVGKVTDVIEGEGVILQTEFRYEGWDEDWVIYYSSISAFLVCDTKNLLDGSLVTGAAYPDGTYTYTTVTGASRKIPRWVYGGPADRKFNSPGKQSSPKRAVLR